MKWLRKWLGIDGQSKTLSLILEELEEINTDLKILSSFIGEMPVPCDKCNNYEQPDYLQICIKCDNAGIVQHKTLMDWPWE